MQQASTPSQATPKAELPGLGPAEVFPAGTTLFRQGHKATILRLIVAGFVKTIREEPQGDALVAIRQPGWILGLAPALLDRTYSTSGIAATTCTLRSLPLSTFVHYLRSTPAAAIDTLCVALRQNQLDDLLRAEMAIFKAPQRLTLALVRLTRLLVPPRRHGYIELSLPISLRELAQYIGVTPEYLGRLLSTCEKSGLLRRRRGVLLLPDTRWPPLSGGPSRSID